MKQSSKPPAGSRRKAADAPGGEREAVGTVLQYYRRRIQCAARVNGRVDQDTEDYITQTLLTAIFKFRFGR